MRRTNVARGGAGGGVVQRGSRPCTSDWTARDRTASPRRADVGGKWGHAWGERGWEGRQGKIWGRRGCPRGARRRGAETREATRTTAAVVVGCCAIALSTGTCALWSDEDEDDATPGGLRAHPSHVRQQRRLIQLQARRRRLRRVDRPPSSLRGGPRARERGEGVDGGTRRQATQLAARDRWRLRFCPGFLVCLS